MAGKFKNRYCGARRIRRLPRRRCGRRSKGGATGSPDPGRRSHEVARRTRSASGSSSSQGLLGRLTMSYTNRPTGIQQVI